MHRCSGYDKNNNKKTKTIHNIIINVAVTTIVTIFVNTIIARLSILSTLW